VARIRTIKPEFWTSEQVVECSTIARLLFIGLWNFADDGGRHPASVKRLKMEVFPGDALDDQAIAGLVGELIAAGLVIKYEAEGLSYWQVTGWQHQKIDRPSFRYPEPKFDEHSTNRLDEHSTSIRRAITPGREGKGRESKGMEGKGVEGRSTNDRRSCAKKAPKETLGKSFDEFWGSYPRKVGKQAARKAFARLKPADRAATLAAVSEFAASALVADSDPDLIPHPATWLNQGRWDDDRAEWDRPKTRGGSPDVPTVRDSAAEIDEIFEAAERLEDDDEGGVR